MDPTFEQPIQTVKSPINHQDVLIENLASLRLNSQLTDITLVTTVDGREFSAHKSILAARSVVFAAMFSHEELEESQKNQVEVPDFSGEVMEAMLSYIYTGKIESIDSFAGDLLVAADKVCLF